MFIGVDHTAYGTPYQPLSVGDLKYRSEMKIDISHLRVAFLRMLIATDQLVIKTLLFLKINLPNAVLRIPNAV